MPGADQWLEGAIRVPGVSAGTHAAGAGSKILHHTTEGGSTAGAVAAYRSSRSWPTLTAEWTGARLVVAQHMPLNLAARALEHPSGPETNRANVVQVEHVGFTDEAWRRRVGANPNLHVSRWPPERWAAIGALCREIEALRDCPRMTPVSLARWQDPNGWRAGGTEFFEGRGHWAHVFVPGNDHLDGTGFKIALVLESDDSASRPLSIGDTGADVRALQAAVRLRASRCGRKDHMPAADGVYGPKTARDAAFVAYVLGVGEDQSSLLADGGLSPYVQRLIRDPSKRNRTQKRRAVSRRAKHCKGA